MPSPRLPHPRPLFRLLQSSCCNLSAGLSPPPRSRLLSEARPDLPVQPVKVLRLVTALSKASFLLELFYVLLSKAVCAVTSVTDSGVGLSGFKTRSVCWCVFGQVLELPVSYFLISDMGEQRRLSQWGCCGLVTTAMGKARRKGPVGCYFCFLCGAVCSSCLVVDSRRSGSTQDSSLYSSREIPLLLWSRKKHKGLKRLGRSREVIWSEC